MMMSRARQRQLTLAASPDRIAAGEAVKITLIIRGPAQVISSCSVPNPEIWAVSPSKRRITLTHASLCQSGGEADVGEGESLTESVYWVTSSDLAPGLYSIHGKLSGFPVPLFSDENLPVIAVQIVGESRHGARQTDVLAARSPQLPANGKELPRRGLAGLEPKPRALKVSYSALADTNRTIELGASPEGGRGTGQHGGLLIISG